jgi:hypothetical protein
MVHAAGDPGFIAWANGIDTSLAALSGTYVAKANTPATAAAGTTIVHDGPTFVATVDPSIAIGYNAGTNWAPVVTTEPAIVRAVEGDYDDGSGNHKAEIYIQIRPKAPKTASDRIRPHFIQYDKVLEKVVAHYLSTGVGGNIELRAGASESSFDTIGTFAKNVWTLAKNSGTDGQFQIQAATGAAAILGLGYDNTDGWGTFRTENAGAPSVSVFAGNGTRVGMFFPTTAGGAAGPAFAVGVNDNSAAGCFKAAVDGAIGLYARRHSATQSANIFEAQNESGTALVAVGPLGGLHLGDNNGAGGATLWSVSGVPSNGIGSNGDYCFRTDAVGTANARLYVRSGGAWVGIL